MALSDALLSVPYQPRFPKERPMGIGIIGCGNIVRTAHLPAYQQYGLRVVGVYDVNPAATEGVQAKFGVQRVFDSVEALLAHPEVEVVDIATHPAQRAALIRQALVAGKHVLSQKPLALDVATARDLVAEAEARGLRLAVNHNGRFAPPWRAATLLVEQGGVGEVQAVTHLYDVKFDWLAGSHFDNIEHCLIYDYSVHWFDITRCWMGEKAVSSVRAREYRTPNQPGQAAWGMWAEIAYADGANAVLRSIGCSETAQQTHHFWIHGTEGVIRGTQHLHDSLELERKGLTIRYPLKGHWFVDGFAASMGELMCAVAEKREPAHSARHNLLSLQITLAACRSADRDGQAVPLE